MDYFSYAQIIYSEISLQTGTYIDEIAEIFLKLSIENSRKTFFCWDDFSDSSDFLFFGVDS